MNEPILSSNLQVITAEINSYKQIAGQSVFEIGKRLKHVKENDLAHGEWENWLGSIDMTPRQAQRFMKVVTELGENASSVSHLGIKTLYEIATMPAEEREKPQVVPSTGETKAPADMTTRELQEVRKALKAAQESAAESEQRAKQAEAGRQLAIQQHTEQQEKLLAQIDELKKREGRSKEDEEQLGRLISENAELTAAKRHLEQEMAERNASLERQAYDLRKMKEALNKTRAYVDVDLSSALVYFLSIRDQREAQEVAVRFWESLDKTIAKNRREWEAVLQNPVIEEVEKNAGTVIDIGGN